ncbi:putative ABC transporter [Trypanosoma cruzi]|uniref:Putative ABC transporter n=1 Tax=Trypanosoma cruzi TaxID=5693 RepID=A0A2V2WTH3_TRYCR|nr:putative ABC transporter [Trypanosoma cruzi]
MFVRRAVAGLGPINSYESAQYYLEQIDRTVDATATKKKVAAAPSKSVFDVGADRQRRSRRPALIFHSKRNASLGGRLREYALSLYRRVLFEIVLALFDAFHMTMRLYTTLLEAFVPGMADARLNEDSLEELLKRRELRFGGPPPRERRAE